MCFMDRVLRQSWLLLAFAFAAGCEPSVAVKNPATNSTTGTAQTSSESKAADAVASSNSSSNSSSAPAAGSTSTPTGLKRLIVLTNGDAPFWDACREGVLATNGELKLKEIGLVAELDVNNGAAQGQLAKLQQYGTQSDIAGVGISATDADNVAIADELRSMQKKGIKVVTIDSDVSRTQFRDARFAFIGTDNLTGGKVLGECAKRMKPEGGEYVTFVGITGAQNAKERIGGFEIGAGSAFINKDSMADDYLKDKARENVRNAIRNHPNLSVLVGIWSYNAPAIVDIVKETNRRKDFVIVTFDAEPTAITAMAEGDIDAMVVQNPFQMGFQGIRCLAALVKDNKEVIAEMFPQYGQPEGDIYDTGLKVVVPNTGSPIKAEMFDKSVEFITLEQMQEWLKKYGLTGS
jgi:ribose transport system substrate-binding protein